jgi:hypothetical protein
MTLIEHEIRQRTHTFQNLRNPSHVTVNAVCSRCGIALFRGLILTIRGSANLPEIPDCQDVAERQDP